MPRPVHISPMISPRASSPPAHHELPDHDKATTFDPKGWPALSTAAASGIVISSSSSPAWDTPLDLETYGDSRCLLMRTEEVSSSLGAFLIPYLLCSFVVGFPILYLEMSLGQFARTGPATVFRKLAPAFQGIGWGQSITSLLVGIYYNVIVGWTLLYLFGIITGSTYKWGSCDNTFNSARCASDLHFESCWEQIPDDQMQGNFFYNGTCNVAASLVRNLSDGEKTSPSEEYFE
uniref:Transporter n=1 Tax=Steinernema glaseri TaxID=37863 RepID=A0A1I7ZGS4_9BILA